MRLTPFFANFLCVTGLLFSVLSHAQTVTHLETTNRGYPVVQVSINGAGPYPFLLDTGSNRTLIQNQLLDALGISSGRLVPANMTTGVSYLHKAVVSSVAVAGLSVHDLEVDGIDAGQISRLGGFQGLLGEDFLKHFDILIDNHARTLTLDDDASGLARSLSGERIPLSFSGMQGGRATADRLVFDLKLPSSPETRHFLIDSGADHIMFFPARPLPFQGRTAQDRILLTFGGISRCHVDAVPLRIGKDILATVDLAFCEGLRGNIDVDGILPASTFTRIFISHSGAYAIANPRIRKPSATSR